MLRTYLIFSQKNQSVCYASDVLTQHHDHYDPAGNTLDYKDCTVDTCDLVDSYVYVEEEIDKQLSYVEEEIEREMITPFHSIIDNTKSLIDIVRASPLFDDNFVYCDPRLILIGFLFGLGLYIVTFNLLFKRKKILDKKVPNKKRRNSIVFQEIIEPKLSRLSLCPVVDDANFLNMDSEPNESPVKSSPMRTRSGKALVKKKNCK